MSARPIGFTFFDGFEEKKNKGKTRTSKKSKGKRLCHLPHEIACPLGGEAAISRGELFIFLSAQSAQSAVLSFTIYY